jgi:hypothetical protein
VSLIFLRGPLRLILFGFGFFGCHRRSPTDPSSPVSASPACEPGGKAKAAFGFGAERNAADLPPAFFSKQGPFTPAAQDPMDPGGDGRVGESASWNVPKNSGGRKRFGVTNGGVTQLQA